jgi:predicted alpha/beta-fold hydrolase
VKEASDYIHKNYAQPANQRMHFYSCSLGGTTVALYLIQEDGHHPYASAALYDFPFDALGTIPTFTKKLGGFYDKVLGLNVKKNFIRMLPEFAKYTPKKLMNKYEDFLFRDPSTRITDFDDKIVAPMFGYKNGLDYYEHAKVTGKLHNLTSCPVMFLQSYDDPLVEHDSFPIQEIKRNPNLLFASTWGGGHCCHLQGSTHTISTRLPILNCISWLFPTQGWFCEPIVEFFVTAEKYATKKDAKENRIESVA